MESSVTDAHETHLPQDVVENARQRPLPQQSDVCCIEEDCDLSFVTDGPKCRTLSGPGFPKMRSGARASSGLCGRSGKFIFHVRVECELKVSLEDAGAESEENIHLCRVGWSTRDSPLHSLGENRDGWGFGADAKKVHAGSFASFGERYGVGDVIGCGIDLQSGDVRFTKNGKLLGTAFTIGAANLAKGIFPHILLKNVEVHVTWDSSITSSDLVDYMTMQEATSDVCTPQLSLPIQPEVVMLVGLPASGKSTWAKRFAEQNPEKRYTILSTDQILEQMDVAGMTCQRNYAERWTKMMSEASSVLNRLLEVAARRKRHFLWDQTNVYASARRRKLAPFVGFRKVARVFVLEKETLQQRTNTRSQEQGKLVPEEAVMQMRSNFVLPSVSEGFDDVAFVGELSGPAAEEFVSRERREAAEWLKTQSSAHRKRHADMPVSSLHAATHAATHTAANVQGRAGYGAIETKMPMHSNMHAPEQSHHRHHTHAPVVVPLYARVADGRGWGLHRRGGSYDGDDAYRGSGGGGEWDPRPHRGGGRSEGRIAWRTGGEYGGCGGDGLQERHQEHLVDQHQEHLPHQPLPRTRAAPWDLADQPQPCDASSSTVLLESSHMTTAGYHTGLRNRLPPSPLYAAPGLSWRCGPGPGDDERRGNQGERGGEGWGPAFNHPGPAPYSQSHGPA